jgi:putative sterol carrier protein
MEQINEEILKELKEEHKGLKEEHQEFIRLLKLTNDKLDKLVEIMEETRTKATDATM